MFVSRTLLHKHFGNLAHIRGIISYKLSPHELKPFATAIVKGIPNFIPRTTATILTWLPAFIGGILVYKVVEEGHRKSLRKNPDDYINEVNPLAEEKVSTELVDATESDCVRDHAKKPIS